MCSIAAQAPNLCCSERRGWGGGGWTKYVPPNNTVGGGTKPMIHDQHDDIYSRAMDGKLPSTDYSIE